jgi:hypothetical protein
MYNIFRCHEFVVHALVYQGLSYKLEVMGSSPDEVDFFFFFSIHLILPAT